MNLKTYQAPTMAEALTAVKRDLGRDAVILHTRGFRKGGFLGLGGRQVWEITASRNVNVRPPRGRRGTEDQMPGLDEPRPRTSSRVAVIDGPAFVPPPSGPEVETTVPDEPAISRKMDVLTEMVEQLIKQHPGRETSAKAPVPEELFDLYASLIQQEVAEDIARELLDKIRSQFTGDQLSDRDLIRERLTEFVASMIPVSMGASTFATGAPRVVALIGPTGVGKTTTIAKLAANLRLRERRNVGLITIDTYRIAAVDQLRTYADIINVPLKVVLTPEELSAAVAEMSDRDVILIDTAGRSQNDSMRLAELEQFLKAANADEVHLVLSTTANQRNVVAAMEKFGHLGVNRLILTKLDEAVSFGMILNIVRKMDAELSYVTTGQDVPDDIHRTEGRKLAELIVGGAKSW